MHTTLLRSSPLHLQVSLAVLLFAAGCGGGATPQQTTSSTGSDGTTVGAGGGGATSSTSSSAGGGASSATTTGVGGGSSTATSGGAGGGNPCQPAFVTAKPPPVCGGPHSGAPTAGVACAGQLCPADQGCCYSIGITCGSSSCYAHADCDGPEDCAAPGEACCVSPSPNLNLPESSYYLGAKCVAKAACTGAGAPACNSGADCAPGESCCDTFDNYGNVNLGICHAGSCD